MIWAVVPAAGSGRRFGTSLPKQYVEIDGKCVLRWTLEALLMHEQICGAMVVLSREDGYWPGWQNIHGKPVLTATGGAERADSVLAGLTALPAVVRDADFVLVHDAARPCLSAADISALIARVQNTDGGLLAAPVRDTIKRGQLRETGEMVVGATVPRADLWRALTPQMFKRAALMQALTAAKAGGERCTDESAAMEALGYAPILVEGADDNLKVTTANDLAIATSVLRAMYSQSAS